MSLIPEQIDGLQHPFAVHGFFDRKGGVSPPPYDSLDVGTAGEDRLHVAENRRRILSAMGTGFSLVSLQQVHGDQVLLVTKEMGRKDGDIAEPVPKADAMITEVPGKLLMIQTADCQAVLLLDPVKKAVAAIHAGWRGSVSRILEKTVFAMQDHFGSCPEDLRAGIGPSLGPCCAEFVNWKTELPDAFADHRIGENHFDFWAISRAQLVLAGLLPENITALGACTRCGDRWFSYRREQTTGRLAAVIGLKKETGEDGADG